MKEDLKSAGKYLVLDLPYTHTTRHFQSLNCVALFIVKKIKSTVCFISFPMLVCESNEIKKYDYSLENIKYFINIFAWIIDIISIKYNISCPYSKLLSNNMASFLIIGYSFIQYSAQRIWFILRGVLSYLEPCYI